MFSRNSVGQKGMTGYIQGNEEEKPTSKFNLTWKKLIQIE